MEEKDITLGYPELPKEEVNSPPLSLRSSDDDEETESYDSDSEEEEGGAGVRTGGAVVSGPPLKKGPWTPDEDRRLRTYVEAHGEGNWNQVQRNAGLNRCGKSCRLRWANHLRPHLKKGPFSQEEEQKIIELHAMTGNKWAQMAAKLPGRTDNEIKNFWNTRKKRLDKAGQGLYPADVLSRVAANRDMDSDSPEDSRGTKRPNELSQGQGIAFDDIIFQKLDYKKRAENFLAPAPTFTLPGSDPLGAMKRDMVSAYSGSPSYEGFPHEPERTCYADIVHSGSGIIAKHAVAFNNGIASGPLILYDNFSTSGAIQRPVKMEPPSVQCTGYEPNNSWMFHTYPAPPLGVADTFISSPESVLMKAERFPENDALLDVIVRQGLANPSKYTGAYEVSPSSVFQGDLLEGSPSDDFRTSKSPASLDAFLADSKHQADDIFSETHLSPLPDACRRPGASSEASFLNEDSPHSEYQPMNDLLYGDSCFVARMLSSPGDGHEHTLESAHWNSMPGARHVPGS